MEVYFPISHKMYLPASDHNIMHNWEGGQETLQYTCKSKCPFTGWSYTGPTFTPGNKLLIGLWICKSASITLRIGLRNLVFWNHKLCKIFSENLWLKKKQLTPGSWATWVTLTQGSRFNFKTRCRASDREFGDSAFHISQHYLVCKETEPQSYVHFSYCG